MKNYNYPIDLVYLWVDGNDPVWQKKKNTALVAAGRPLSVFQAGDNRFADNDELKYSLRSAEKFAPWINHIFIVTMGQRPKWLNDNPKITIIDHSEIIPKKYLPVFNSNAIEMFLGFIPKLSEHFLYANDDFFFNRPVTPDFFFDKNGNPVVIMQEKPWVKSVFTNDDIGHMVARDVLFKKFIAHTLYTIYKRTNKKYELMMVHAIEPMRKSYFIDTFNQYKNEIMATTVTPFRAADNLQRMLFPLTDNIMGRNTIVLKRKILNHRIKYHGKHPVLYHIMMLGSLLTGLARTDIVDSTRNTTAKIKKRKPYLIAMNALTETDNMFLTNKKYIDELLPDKSEFEK